MTEPNPLLSDAPMSDQLALYEQFVDNSWFGGSSEYTIIALAGEVGEACNMYKKGMRDPGMGHDPDWKSKMIAELGDSFFYLVRACHDQGTTLRAVMLANERKLRARHGTKEAT